MRFAVVTLILIGGGTFMTMRLADGAADAKPGFHDEGVTSRNAPGEWISIGPSPLNYERNQGNNPQSGRVSAIAVDPADARHWLLGVGNGGVWESHDAGGSWVPLTDSAPTLATGAIAFAPSDPSVIYVGTGESASAAFAKTGLGILKSTDGGDNWTLLGESAFARATVKRLRVHPTNPNLVVAITARGGFGRSNQIGAPSPPPFGVLRSNDGGSTWTRLLEGQGTALEADSRNFDRLYAAIGDQRVGIAALRDASERPNGVYRSVDGGTTWGLVEGPWGSSSPTRSTVGRIELALAPSNPDVLYASMQIPPNTGPNNTGLLGLYRTDNAWDSSPTWTEVPTAATGSGGFCGPAKCGYSHVLSVDPLDANTLLAGGGERGLWRCADCGSAPRWTHLTPDASGIHPDHHALAWAGNRLIDGNDGGIWSSVDRGQSWQNHNRGLPTLMFFSAALHPTNPDFILSGLRDFQGVYRRGGAWLILPQIGSWEWGEAEVAVSRSRPDTDWMIAWLNGDIARTTDGGRTGIEADAGIDKVGATLVAPVRKCPTDDNVFLTGTNRVWRTNNFFSSAAPVWEANSPPHPFQNPQGLTAPGTILAIAFAPGSGCAAYAFGNRGGQIQLTRDGGGTWKDMDSGRRLPARHVNGLAFDPTNPEILYAAYSSFDNASPDQPGHVFKTTNAMSDAPTWTNVSPPLDQPFNVIAIDPAQPLEVYAGSDTGLWRSHDGTQTWVRVGPESGIPNAPVYDIQINPTTRTTIVFTYGRGAYQLVARAEP